MSKKSDNSDSSIVYHYLCNFKKDYETLIARYIKSFESVCRPVTFQIIKILPSHNPRTNFFYSNHFLRPRHEAGKAPSRRQKKALRRKMKHLGSEDIDIAVSLGVRG